MTCSEAKEASPHVRQVPRRILRKRRASRRARTLAVRVRLMASRTRRPASSTTSTPGTLCPSKGGSRGRSRWKGRPSRARTRLVLGHTRPLGSTRRCRTALSRRSSHSTWEQGCQAPLQQSAPPPPRAPSDSASLRVRETVPLPSSKSSSTSSMSQGTSVRRTSLSRGPSGASTSVTTQT